mmetsp:Transcript_3148/g.5974  ORF Transcript_3148/g.5974 Transcript_3148/m.5974 type:complete len:80 (-) Transcript_3148:518-757(-)
MLVLENKTKVASSSLMAEVGSELVSDTTAMNSHWFTSVLRLNEFVILVIASYVFVCLMDESVNCLLDLFLENFGIYSIM